MFVRYTNDYGQAIIELKSVAIHQSYKGDNFLLYANYSDVVRSVVESAITRFASLLVEPDELEGRLYFHSRKRDGYTDVFPVDSAYPIDADKQYECSIASFETEEDANNAVNALYEAMVRGDKVFDMRKYESDAWDKRHPEETDEN